MHKALDIHRRHELPRIAHHTVPLHQVKSFAIIAAKDVDILTVARGYGAERATSRVHALHVDPLLLVEIKLLNCGQILPSIVTSDRINTVG